MEMIRQVNATKIILGAGALSIKTGITTPILKLLSSIAT